jgi:hypothetical protein
MLLLAALACWALGCTARSEPRPQPKAANAPPARQPEPEAPTPEPEPTLAPHEFEAWLETSPLRTTMRSMWLSAGMISANAGGYRNIDFDALESNAENIARKAGGFATMWETIRDANRQMALKARERDWAAATTQSQRVWKSCTDCHVETWSPHARGFMPESIDGWLENGNAAENVPYSGLNLSSTPEFLAIMFRMVAYLDRSVSGIENNNADEVLKWTQSMDAVVAEQLELWRTVERHARAIADIAAKADTLNVDRQYTKMIKGCADCHEKYVTDERSPKNPLPWKYRNER